MHEMQTIAIDDPRHLSVTQVGCAKTTERIDVLFEVETPGGPRNTVLDGGRHTSGCREEIQYSLLPNYFGHLL